MYYIINQIKILNKVSKYKNCLIFFIFCKVMQFVNLLIICKNTEVFII
jgi:hypothetical protein